MKDFRFGTLVLLPTGDLRQISDRLRQKFDPISARTCAAHITITQPFTVTPTKQDIQKVQGLIVSFSRIKTQIGPATTSPNKRLIWLDVNPKNSVLRLRDELHETGLFRTDRPFTKGFIPHLTISENQRDPEEVVSILDDLNSKYKPRHILFDAVAWIIADDDFVFHEHYSFRFMKT